jgi:hypothetical protein
MSGVACASSKWPRYWPATELDVSALARKRSFGAGGSIARPRSSAEALWSRRRAGTHSYPSPTSACCKWRRSRANSASPHSAGPAFAPPPQRMRPIHLRNTCPLAARKRRSTLSSPVEAYARDVLTGRIVAGQLVRLACKRHLNDLVHGSKRVWCWTVQRHSTR